MSRIRVQVERMSGAHDLPLPSYATDGSAGLDLLAAIRESLTLATGERRLVGTGIRLALPPATEAQVRPRSGLALKHGITVLNAPGTIDSDYRGEVAVILVNLGEAPYTIRRGERIAQLVVAPVHQVVWLEAETLSESLRGSGGFGSSGAFDRGEAT